MSDSVLWLAFDINAAYALGKDRETGKCSDALEFLRVDLCIYILKWTGRFLKSEADLMLGTVRSISPGTLQTVQTFAVIVIQQK